MWYCPQRRRSEPFLTERCLMLYKPPEYEPEPEFKLPPLPRRFPWALVWVPGISAAVLLSMYHMNAWVWLGANVFIMLLILGSVYCFNYTLELRAKEAKLPARRDQ